MGRRNFLVVSVFLVFILAFSGILLGQRVVDLDKVWGDMRVLGDDTDDWSGKAVAYGDINGDGYMDIIIGASYADPPGRDYAGETYVIFGSTSPATTIDLDTQSADITVYGIAYWDCSGTAVASGDVNGDGYDDIIISAPYSDPGGRNMCGEVYLIFGSSSPPSTVDLSTQSADITIYGDDAEDRCGSALAIGNVNGDGYEDIIIGTPRGEPGGKYGAGETYVIFGSSFPTPPYTIYLSTQPADITVYGDDAYEFSGDAVASGDVNGDNYDDVIIGARLAHTLGGDDAGKTYVIFGSASPPATIDLDTQSADITVCGDDASDFLGEAVASGDVNGDGYDDIISGAWSADPPGGDRAGETYVIFGGSYSSPPYTIDLNTVSADITICGDNVEDYLGKAVASGNVNGDGYDDLIIAAYPADPPGRTGAGETYIILGGGRFTSPPYTIDLDTQSADITIYGDDDYDASSYAVASGDMNGDGYSDIIIGAYAADPPGGSAAGETYLILGGGAIITAHGLGGASQIRAFSHLGRRWSDFKAFGPPNAQGEVHLAIGDIDGDHLDEIVAGHGEGGDSWVKLFEMDGTLIRKFKAFDTDNSQGEVHLAIGNFNANLDDKEIAVAHGEGGQSLVKIFRADGSQLRKFRAFGPPNAQGEVHLASGDLFSDGIDEIIVGMGEGGSSLIKIFNHRGILIRKFRAFGPAGNPGGEVHLTVGNFDADPALEIATATGYNGGNWVRLFEKDGTSIRRFVAFGPPNANGEVHLVAADLDNDGVDEIIVGMGEGGSSMVKVFKADGTRIRSFTAFGGANSQGEVHLGKSDY